VFEGQGAPRRAIRIVGASIDVTLEKGAESSREALRVVARHSRLATPPFTRAERLAAVLRAALPDLETVRRLGSKFKPLHVR